MKKHKFISTILFTLFLSQNVNSQNHVTEIFRTNEKLTKAKCILDIILAETDENYYVMDTLGNLKSKISKDLYEGLKITRFAHFLTFEQDQKFGLLTLQGSMLIPSIYESIDAVRKDEIIVELHNKKAIINSKHELLFQFPEGYDLSDIYYNYTSFGPPYRNVGHLYIIEDDDGLIVCDAEDNQVDIPNIRSIKTFDENYLVRTKSGFGLIDKNLNELIPFKYEHMNKHKLENGYPFCYIKNRKREVKIANKSGIILSDEWYDEIRTVGNNFLAVKKQYGEKQFFLYDVNWNLIKKFDSHTVLVLNNYLINRINKNERGVLLDSNGKKKQFPLDSVKNYRIMEDYFVLQDSSGKWGIFDHHGLEKFPCQYKSIISQGYGHLVFNKGELVVNKNLETICHDVDFYLKIKGKFIELRRDSKYGLFSESGQEIIPFDAESIKLISKNLFLVTRNESNQIIKIK